LSETETVNAKDAIRDFSANKNGDDNAKKLITALVVPLIAALTVQAAAASERHHTRTKSCPVASEQLLNSDAYDAHGDVAAAESYWQNYADGMMASGPAGR